MGKKRLLLLISIFTVACNSFANEKSASSEIPIMELVSAVAKKLNNSVLLDPRVKGNVMIEGQSLEAVTYENLLTILNLHGYTAYKNNGYLTVITLREARTSATDVVRNTEVYLSNQYVTDVIEIKKSCSTELVPILRPLSPQQSHMAASIKPNAIIITDTYANILRLREIINKIESKLEKPLKCDTKKK